MSQETKKRRRTDHVWRQARSLSLLPGHSDTDSSVTSSFTPPRPPPPHTRPTTRFPLPICRETIAALRTASVKHELVLRQRFDLPHITLVTCHGRETRGGKSTADFVRVILGDCLTAMRNSTCLPLPVLHR